MSDDVRAAAIAQIMQALEAQGIAADEFTVGMFAEQAGMDVKAARDALLKLERGGMLKSRKVLHEGRWQWAFRSVGDTRSLAHSGADERE
jgi:hypothetical protein